MKPEELDRLVTAVLQECVNSVPDDFTELWLVLEDEDGVSTGIVLFTGPAGPRKILDLGDDLDFAIEDLVEAAARDGQPIHRAVLNYRSSGGANADFDYDPLPGGAVGGPSRARFNEFAQRVVGLPLDEVAEYEDAS